MKVKKKKLKIKNVLLVLLFLVSLCTFIFSIYKIIGWAIDNKKTSKVVKNIEETTEIEEVKDNDKTEIIESKEDKANPYWDYIKMNLINVDFSDLKKKNSDTKGWIQVIGTNINYPFVQTKNNDYYLSHSFDKSYNDAGWVFVDYRNSISKFDKNTIVYAHGRYDKTMFGSLKNILKSNWYSDINNHVIKLSTENENTLWQVFSVYKIKTTSDYIQTEFSSDETFLKFLNMLKKRSNFKFNIELSKSDKIITLSTCYNDTEKVVLHAKLIKQQKR